MVGTIVACSAESDDLRNFFLDLFDQALTSFGSAPRERDVDSWVEHATRLFADLETASATEIRGIWGELLVISEAHNPSALIRRWHETPEDRYDFVAGAFVLEVKTCRDPERVHIFSLAQIRPTTALHVLIASVPVYADPQGMSALDLLSEIEARISDSAIRQKLRGTVFRTGGLALAQSSHRFDRRAAAEGIRLIPATSIPAVEERLSPDILDVRVTVRCRDIPGDGLTDAVEQRFGD